MKPSRLAVAIVVLCLAAFGQEAWLVPFAAAYQPDVAGFNQAFAAHGLPRAGSRHFGWGIELRSLVSGLLVGPLYFRTWDDAETDSFELRTEASGLFAEVGLRLAPAPFLGVVPMVGVGGLSQSFDIRAKTGERKLEELLSSPGQRASILSGTKLAGLAALELNLSTGTGSGRYGVALRAGYLYSPLSVTWHLPNGSRVTDTPVNRLSGPFFSLGLLLLPAAETQTTRF